MIALALRTWARYALPLILVSLVALAPLWYLALALPAPVDVTSAKRAITIAVAIAIAAWLFQLWLVGGAAPLVRAVHASTPLSQRRAVRVAFAGLGTAVLPWLCTLAALFGGSLALVVPGMLALAMFSLAGASTAPGLPAPLVESAAIVRRQLRATVAILVGSALVLAGIVVGSKLALAPSLPKPLTPASLAGYRDAARLVGLGAIAMAPLVATLLAAIHAHGSAEPAGERGA